MKLYHGSNQDFSVVDFSKSKDKRDFGKGFYMTTIKKQAHEWAAKLFDRFGGDGINVYEFELSNIDDLSLRQFEGLTEEWLKFIIENRKKGGLQHGFDVVQGAVANDDTTRTINLFTSGAINLSYTLDQLKYMHPNDQVSIHTAKALSHLRMIGREQYAK
jgi:hypothetical protein